MKNTYCFVVSLKANAPWLKLPRQDRVACWKKVGGIVAEYSEQVSFEYHDADAFHADYSDLVICYTADPIHYHHLWDRIKDTDIFTESYYRIADVRMGIRGVSHG